MRIQLTLNDKPVILEADPAEMLISTLRRENLVSVKHGCHSESCGSCYVLIEGHIAASCRTPVGILQGSSVVTLEYFSKTDMYNDIMKGFEKAGISLCGYCNAGKIFSTYEVLKYIQQPTREKIEVITGKLNDCCIEKDTFINGILYAYSIHFTKEKQRKNGN